MIDLLDAAVLSEKDRASDEDRELPFEADCCGDPEAAFEIEAEWDGVRTETVGVLWDRLSDEERVELRLHDCAGRDPVDAETVRRRRCRRSSGASAKTRAPARRRPAPELRGRLRPRPRPGRRVCTKPPERMPGHTGAGLRGRGPSTSIAAPRRSGAKAAPWRLDRGRPSQKAMTRTPSSWSTSGTRSAKSGWTDVSRETNWAAAEGGGPEREVLLRIIITEIWVGIVGLVYAARFVCVVAEAISCPTVG